MSSLAWRRRGGPALSLGVGATAMLAVIPGAVNLSIAVGAAGSGVRAAGRILDVDGPAFRGAWIAGSVAGLLLYMAAALLLGRSLRSTFGPVRQVAAPLPGVVGYTADGRPVFAQVGFTSDGIPVLADQLEARYPARPAVGTNALAIVALVLGIFGGVLAIPVGHVSLNQIRRSGESGRGLAVAGLVSRLSVAGRRRRCRIRGCVRGLSIIWSRVRVGWAGVARCRRCEVRTGP